MNVLRIVGARSAEQSGIINNLMNLRSKKGFDNRWKHMKY